MIVTIRSKRQMQCHDCHHQVKETDATLPLSFLLHCANLLFQGQIHNGNCTCILRKYKALSSFNSLPFLRESQKLHLCGLQAHCCIADDLDDENSPAVNKCFSLQTVICYVHLFAQWSDALRALVCAVCAASVPVSGGSSLSQWSLRLGAACIIRGSDVRHPEGGVAADETHDQERCHLPGTTSSPFSKPFLSCLFFSLASLLA